VELRYAFDDLLFAMTRQPAVKREMVPDAGSRYALGCPQRAELVRVLDLAALIAARRYEAGHPDVVADFYCVLADALRAQLEEAKCCAAISARLSDALIGAEDLQGGADVAALMGAAFDELRFEGSAGDVLEVPPAEAAVVASSEQIDEVADVLVRAIGTGAAWYNAGDVEGCLRLYLQTCERVLGTLKAGRETWRCERCCPRAWSTRARREAPRKLPRGPCGMRSTRCSRRSGWRRRRRESVRCAGGRGDSVGLRRCDGAAC